MAEEVIGGYRLVRPMATGQMSQVWEVVEVNSGRHFAMKLLLPEKAVLLSETAAEILQLCDGGSTVAELIADLERKYPTAELRADVVEFLSQAVSKRWVEWVLPA